MRRGHCWNFRDECCSCESQEENISPKWKQFVGFSLPQRLSDECPDIFFSISTASHWHRWHKRKHHYQLRRNFESNFQLRRNFESNFQLRRNFESNFQLRRNFESNFTKLLESEEGSRSVSSGSSGRIDQSDGNIGFCDDDGSAHHIDDDEDVTMTKGFSWWRWWCQGLWACDGTTSRETNTQLRQQYYTMGLVQVISVIIIDHYQHIITNVIIINTNRNRIDRRQKPEYSWMAPRLEVLKYSHTKKYKLEFVLVWRQPCHWLTSFQVILVMVIIKFYTRINMLSVVAISCQ